MTMRSTIGSKRELQGDWRRRAGTKTDAHLYDRRGDMTRLPLCYSRIPRNVTVRVEEGRPCSDCLVAAIRRAGS